MKLLNMTTISVLHIYPLRHATQTLLSYHKSIRKTEARADPCRPITFYYLVYVHARRWEARKSTVRHHSFYEFLYIRVLQRCASSWAVVSIVGSIIRCDLATYFHSFTLVSHLLPLLSISLPSELYDVISDRHVLIIRVRFCQGIATWSGLYKSIDDVVYRHWLCLYFFSKFFMRIDFHYVLVFIPLLTGLNLSILYITSNWWKGKGAWTIHSPWKQIFMRFIVSLNRRRLGTFILDNDELKNQVVWLASQHCYLLSLISWPAH